MKKIPILMLLLLLIWSSCDDDTPEILPHTIVKGRVLEYGTNEPVVGAKVNLLGGEWNLGGSFGSIQDTFLTDADGYYEFTYTPKKNYMYFLDAEKEKYWDFIPTLDFSQYKENNLDIVLDPEAYLELHIKNVNPFDNNDYINVNGTPSGPWHGQDIDIKTTIAVRGNKEEQVSWFITKNDSSYNQTELIYCKAHELTQYEIFY